MTQTETNTSHVGFFLFCQLNATDILDTGFFISEQTQRNSPRVTFHHGQVLRLRCLFAVTGEIIHLSPHHTYAKHLKSFHLFQPVILNFPSTFPTSLSVTCKVPDSVFTGLITQVVSTLFSCFAKTKVFIAVKYCSF